MFVKIFCLRDVECAKEPICLRILCFHRLPLDVFLLQNFLNRCYLTIVRCWTDELIENSSLVYISKELFFLFAVLIFKETRNFDFISDGFSSVATFVSDFYYKIHEAVLWIEFFNKFPCRFYCTSSC